MNKLLVLIATSVVAVTAQANNTITFQGEVAAQTCTVDVNGTQGSVTVLLPTASTTELAASGNTAKATPFTINLTGCTAPTTAATYSTVFVANNVNTATGNLSNTGSASNVDIQILNTKQTAIDFNSTYEKNNDLTLAANATNASAEYTAQYYATGAATQGSVVAALQYAISYQ